VRVEGKGQYLSADRTRELLRQPLFHVLPGFAGIGDDPEMELDAAARASGPGLVALLALMVADGVIGVGRLLVCRHVVTAVLALVDLGRKLMMPSCNFL